MRTRAEIQAATDRLDAEIALRLCEANRQLAEAEAAVEAAKQVRAAIVVEAVSEGWSFVRIGAVLGLSKQRVAQIKHESEGS
jgi:hypothetical protein